MDVLFGVDELRSSERCTLPYQLGHQVLDFFFVFSFLASILTEVFLSSRFPFVGNDLYVAMYVHLHE